MKVLITGGAGYLGSIVCRALSDNGHIPVILDSLVTGNEEFVKDNFFYQGDIADRYLISQILTEHNDIEIAIHCAERAAVSVSVGKPYEFYTANVVKSMELFKSLSDAGCKKIILASSAAIYDDVPGFMVTEHSPINPRSPFAHTKYMSEMILRDFCDAYNMKCIALRYFNPIGADPQTRCGLKETNPNNIIGRLMQILDHSETAFEISGTDWETRDGTCIRDYIHIWDVGMANVMAVENFDAAFERAGVKSFLPINIGSGVGVTVQEFIYAFQNVTGEKIPIVKGRRRPGDIAGSYANIACAAKTIKWEAQNTLEDAIIDAIRWEEKKRELTGC